MSSFRKVVFILIVLGAGISTAVAVMAAEPLVLTVRLELIKNSRDQNPAAGKPKNPFVWDSTNGAVATDESFSQLKIEGILWNKTNPQAIINGRLVSVNDELQGLTIKKIDKDSLTLKRGNIVHKLEFTDSIINLKTKTGNGK